jgi:uncharacterized protein
MEPRRYLLVDGHSVLFAWPDLRATHAKRPAQARQQLVEILDRLHDSGTWAVTLVFDGRIGTTPVRPANAMVISYGTSDQTADSIIEKIAGAHAGQKDIWVVTADEAERQTVESLGATAVSPQWLRLELEQADQDITRTLDQVKRRAKW